MILLGCALSISDIIDGFIGILSRKVPPFRNVVFCVEEELILLLPLLSFAILGDVIAIIMAICKANVY